MTSAVLTAPSGSTAPSGVVVAEVTRRDVRTGAEVVESIHAAHLVVVDGDGGVVRSLGDPDRSTFVRSAAKPFQAAGCLEVLADGAVAAAGHATPGAPTPDPPVPALPSPAEIAVAWASHRGEPEHLAAVARLLERAGLDPERLTCPTAAAEADPGGRPSRLQHNCSGKHALFALAGQVLGTGGEDLLDPDGPLQRRVLEVVARYLGPARAVGVDGCGAPAVVVGLRGLAHGFARLAVEERLSPVREAGLANPGLVGGEGRLESALLRAGLVSKVGAEGVYGVAWTDAVGRPWGLAVKGDDGSVRGVAAAVVAVLSEAGAITPAVWEAPAPQGGGRPAGEVRATEPVRTLGRELGALIAAG